MENLKKNRAKTEVSIVDRSESIIKSAEETGLGNSSSRVTNRMERESQSDIGASQSSKKQRKRSISMAKQSKISSNMVRKK